MAKNDTAGSKRHDVQEEWAIHTLTSVIQRSKENEDALPGTVVKLIKVALIILKKRRP